MKLIVKLKTYPEMLALKHIININRKLSLKTEP
jgi:hypothetical protein